jgi:hypothetical protein
VSSSGAVKAVARKYRWWRDGRLGTFGSASPVRRIDPKSGERQSLPIHICSPVKFVAQNIDKFCHFIR